jgi:hypothetical protein
MRIEPDQVRAVVAQLVAWGVYVRPEIIPDLVAEFDVRSDLDENKPGKFSRKSEESRRAALKATPRTGTQRRKIYDYIKFAGEADRDQIAMWLKMSPNSVRPRVVELIEGGWVRSTGKTKKNLNGQDVEILEAVK